MGSQQGGGAASVQGRSAAGTGEQSSRGGAIFAEEKLVGPPRRAAHDKPRVVIIGAGFGGLAAAQALKRAPVQVIVLDRTNHHTFQPLLYQVATAGLSSTDIAAPIREILARQRNATVLLQEAVAVDAPRRVVRLRDGELPYDFLILAAGATHSYFGHNHWAEHAPGLKTLEDALEIRRRILLAYEAAEDPRLSADQRRRLLTFVVIGGGPTGVELAGALAEIAQKTMTRNFRNFDPGSARILLLEAGPRLLPAFPEKASQRARRDLEDLGVEVLLNTPAKNITPEGVELPAEFVSASTVLWGAGVAAAPLGRTLGAEVDRAGRVKVKPDLTIEGRPELFVIGDMAALEQDGALLPGVAPVAIQQGAHAAQNILRALRGAEHTPFRYLDPGIMATIGRHRAVARLGNFLFSGFFAWLLWIFVHIMSLVEFRSRVAVFFEWAWMYVTFRRGARIILARERAAHSSAAQQATSAAGE
jgi:NADH dehydrogenase